MNMLMKFKKTLGKLVLLQDRIRYYMSLVQFFMVSFIFFQNISGKEIFDINSMILLYVSILLGICLLIFDWKVIYPSTQNERTMRNPYFTRIESKLEEISKLISDKK